MDSGKLIYKEHPLIADHDLEVVLDFQPGESLYRFLHRHIPNLDPATMTVHIAGKPVPMHLWHHVYLKDGQRDIVVRSTLHKNAMYIVAVIALTVFTAGLGGAVMAGSTTGLGGAVMADSTTGFFGGMASSMAAAGLSTAASMAVVGAIQAAGALLINKVLGPKPPKLDKIDRDSVYTLSAARNSARQYEPFGLLFGETLVTPDYLSKPYSKYFGNDQYMEMLLTPGFNVASFEPLMIGDTPISNYQEVKVWKRGFSAMSDDVIPISVNVDTLPGGALEDPGVWITRTLPEKTLRIQVDIAALIFDLTSKGKPKNNQETIRVEYRAVGQSAWTLLGNNTIVSQSRNEIRRSYVYEVPEGQYEVRVRRLGLDTNGSGATCEVTLTAIAAHQADPTDYDGVAIIGLEMKATGQLNGAPDEVRGVMRARPIPFWTGSAWTTATTRANGLSNPAANVLQYIRGYRDSKGKLVAGMGWPDSMIDIASFQSWMVHCTEMGLTYDAWITSERSHEEMIKAIALAGLGDVDFSRGKATAIFAAEAQPTSGVVNMGNIKKATFQIDYTLASAADGIEYTFFDRTNWETKTLRVNAPGVVGDPQNPAKLTGEGVTTEAHAALMVRYHMAQMIYQFKDIVFSQDLEHMTYGRMSMLQVQHDLTQWGYGGRLRAARNVGGVIELDLDDIVPGPPANNAWIGIRMPGEMNYRVLKVKMFSGESGTIQLDAAWPAGVPFPGNTPDNPAHDYIWIYDFKQTPGLRCRVVAISPDDDLRGASVAVVPEGPEFWNYVKNGDYIPPKSGSLLNTRPVCSNLRVTQERVVQGDTVFLMFHANWQVDGKAEYFTVSCNGREVAMTTALSASWRQDEAGDYVVIVRPFGEGGVPGTASALQVASEGADTPPVLVDYFDAQETPAGLRRYTWGFNPGTIQSPDFRGVEIRYIEGHVTLPPWDEMTPIGDGHEVGLVETAQPPAGTWTFACRSVNSNGTLSLNMRVITRTFTHNLDENVENINTDLDTITAQQVAAQAALDQEIADRLAGDLAESQARADAIAAQQAALADEVQARADAIAAEQAARLAGDAAEATARANALAAEAAARTQAIQEEANARATALLNEKNEREAAISAEATIRQTADESLAVEIASVAAGTGEQFDSKRIWYFDSDLESWTSNGGTPTIEDGWLRPANHASDPYVTSPDNLGIDGSAYRFVKLRIKKVGNPGNWQGSLYWITTTDNVWNEAKKANFAEPVYNADGVATITINDVPWWPSTVRRIRLDFSNLQNADNYYLVDWVAIGRPTPGAGVALVQDEAAARIAGDAAEATQRATLAAQLRGDYTGTDVNAVTSGLIYSERQARVSGDQANASAISSLQARMPSGSGKLATEASVTEEASARVAADNALSTRVSTVEARMPTGTGQLATAAAVQAVEGRVSSVEGTVNSQSSAITSLTNRVGQAELAGTNQLPNPGFEIDSFWTLQPGWEYAAGEGRNGSRCVKRSARAGGGTQVHCSPYRVPVSPGQVWRIRSWYKTTADFNGTSGNSKFRLGDQNNTLINSATAPFTVSTEWKMTDRTYTVPADGSVTHLRVYIIGDNSEGTLWVDDVSLENITELSELQNADAANANAIAGLTTRVTSAEGSITSQGSAITSLQNSVTGLSNTKADASALNALDSRVSATESGLSSQGSSITTLTNSLKGALSAQSDIIPNPGFDPAGFDMGMNNGTTILASTASEVPAGCPYPYVARIAQRDHYPTGMEYTQTTPGDVWEFTALVACGTGNATFNHYARRTSRVGASATSTRVGTGMAASSARTWVRVTHRLTIPDDGRELMRPFLQIGQSNSSPDTVWYVADWHVRNITAAAKAQATADAAASATSALTTRVTNAENSLTSQGNAITSLQNSVSSLQSGKADASALNSLTTRVTNAENVNTSQGTAITALQNSVTGLQNSKADASALNALDSRVTTAEGQISSQGSSITTLTNRVELTRRQGASLLDDGSFEGYSDGQVLVSDSRGSYTVTNRDKRSGSQSVLIKRTGNITQNMNWYGNRFNVSPGQVYYVEAWVKRDPTATAPGANTRINIGLNLQDETLSKNSWLPAGGLYFVDATDWTKISGYVTVPQFTAQDAAAEIKTARPWIQQPGANSVINSAVFLDDMIVVEVTEGYRANQALEGKADASALSALTTRVSNAENSLTSQGSAITSLQNSVTGLSNTKADASALNALTTRVTQNEGSITSQGSAITALQNRMPAGNGTLATAAALNALESIVEDHDDQITAQGNAITAVGAALDGKADASVVQELTATVEAQGDDLAKVLAQYFLSVNANGKIAGMKLGSDGAVGTAEFLADIFRVTSDGASGLEWQNGYLRAYGTGYQFIIGTGFGASNNLVMWYGPNIGAANCTINNCIECKTIDGTTYIRGSTGQGSMVITQTAVEVRDASNNLRVRMGMW